jgi:hypothetical protein
MDPRFLELSTSWTWVFSITPRPLYPLEMRPRFPFDKGLGGPQNRSGRSGEMEIFWSHRDSNTDTLVFQPVASRYTDCATAALKVGNMCSLSAIYSWKRAKINYGCPPVRITWRERGEIMSTQQSPTCKCTTFVHKVLRLVYYFCLDKCWAIPWTAVLRVFLSKRLSLGTLWTKCCTSISIYRTYSPMLAVTQVACGIIMRYRTVNCDGYVRKRC